jgi:hypothetical protein
MEQHIHDIGALFEQLGLDNSVDAISEFIDKNKRVPGNVELHHAKIWNASQASFLKQAIDEDADWAQVVDQLDAMLR